jgi:LysM repeat protein
VHAVRQAASGLVYGIVSLLLVVGSLALAMAQGTALSPRIPTFTPLPSSTPTQRPSPTGLLANTATSTRVALSASAPASTSASPVPFTATAKAATSTSSSPCGAPYGWVKTYVVQAGDTLFRIATRYGISVDELRRANCRSGTVIFVGERLWVPFTQPMATELTIIPTFPTPTEPATATASESPSETPVTPDP